MDKSEENRRGSTFRPAGICSAAARHPRHGTERREPGLLLKKAVSFVRRERELILYGFFGICTTVINIAVFQLCRHIRIPLIPANVIAWVFAVLTAFITNKTIVFGSRDWNGSTARRELLLFFAARVFTLLVDTVLLYAMVERLGINQLLSKAAVNIIVIILNYIVSKFLIFNRRNPGP